MLSQTFALSLLTSDINDAKNGFYICYVLLCIDNNVNLKKIQNSVARGERGGTNMNSRLRRYAR